MVPPTSTTIRLAAPAELPAVHALLARAGLPVDGLDALPDGSCVAVDDGGRLVGCASVERHGAHALLRSVAVDATARSAGLGARLVDDRLRALIDGGARSVSLLTTDADDWFRRFGFLPCARAALPDALEASALLRGACPDSARAMTMDLGGGTLVEPARREDCAALLAIYNAAVADSTATYDYDPRTLAEQLAIFDDKATAGLPFFVARRRDGEIAGFATYGLFRTRPGWRFAVEHSVYVAAPFRGRRVGLQLLPPLMRHARARGFHTMVGVVDARNDASLRLHARAGFETVGILREGGYKFDRWLDVAFIQAML